MTAERSKVLLHRYAMAASRGETDRQAEREILERIEAGDGAAAARAEIADLRARLAEAVSVLQSIEWRWDGECMECFSCQEDGHAPDCRLAAVLAASTTGGDPCS